MHTGKPEHLKTFDYLGLHRYFLTFCTHQRRSTFIAADRTNLVLLQIRRAAVDEGFAILAYCFMPDHIHLLIEALSDDVDCRRFIARGKQFSGFYYQQTFRERLWQRYGFERTLRDDDDALAVARYVLENPVRAGLVQQVQDYAFAGSDTHSVEAILEAIQMRRGWYRGSG